MSHPGTEVAGPEPAHAGTSKPDLPRRSTSVITKADRELGMSTENTGLQAGRKIFWNTKKEKSKNKNKIT